MITVARNFCLCALAVVVSAYLARRGFQFAAGIVWLPLGFLLELED